ncbi:MAG: dTDP-4-dehydrorhamnose 3,5-epimerase family protein [Actinomycetota bacterium]|nr:dTDP-4-dehydrorhamnose 3,5-epimerase family protein [Actinomycetota bacterium]
MAKEADLDRVVGFSSSTPRRSNTTADGSLRIDLIDGVRYRLARTVVHDKGHLVEMYRSDWGLTEPAVAQVNLTVTLPGRVRAWGLHRSTLDRLFASTGSLCIVCYDGRRDSPTFGTVNEFLLGGQNPGMVVIPPGLYHGWKNVGEGEASIVSMPSRLYDYECPDRWELPWDSKAAHEIIPYRWT